MGRELESVQVVGLGQVCVDYVGRVPTYPVEDGKMELENLFTSCGGPAATALVSLTRLGIATSFLGSISDDTFGVRIADTLQKEGVNISFLKITPGHSSQFAFIAVTKGDGKRTIFWNRSSAPDLTPKEISLDRFPGARILHVDGLMLDAGKEAADQAKKRGMIVVMDAGTLRQGTLDLVSRVDILIASEPFGDALIGEQTPRQKVLQRMRELGPRQAVITLGAKGSIGLDQSGMVRQDAFPVVSRDTTGAGDVYHGAYIYGLLQGWNMAKCMAFASAAAALKCTYGRGWEGIPDIQAIDGLMKGQNIDSTGSESRFIDKLTDRT
jgi:ribokinase